VTETTVTGSYYFKNKDGYAGLSFAGLYTSFFAMGTSWVLFTALYAIHTCVGYRKTKQDVKLQLLLLRYPFMQVVYLTLASFHVKMRVDGNPDFHVVEWFENLTYSLAEFYMCWALLRISQGYKITREKLNYEEEVQIFALSLVYYIGSFFMSWFGDSEADISMQYFSSLLRSVIQIFILYYAWVSITRIMYSLECHLKAARRHGIDPETTPMFSTLQMLTRTRYVYFVVLFAEAFGDVVTVNLSRDAVFVIKGSFQCIRWWAVCYVLRIRKIPHIFYDADGHNNGCSEVVDRGTAVEFNLSVEDVTAANGDTETGLAIWNRGTPLPPNPAIGLLKPYRRNKVVVISNPGQDEPPSVGVQVIARHQDE